MAGTSPTQHSLEDHDESVRIAVRALGDMKNASHPGPSPSTSPPSESVSPDFVSRVTSLPLVGSALRAYEHGKASSRVVKYGAEMMESSVKNISRPVIDRLPVDVNQLDEFACRQLDRLERYRRPSTAEDRMQVDPPPSQSPDSRDSPSASKVAGSADATGSRTPTPQSQDPNSVSDRQVVPRSRWQSVLLEAGGIGVAVSEESMRRLKYCLQWLQYATAHIDSQILVLRDFIDSLQSYVLDPSESDAYISPTHLRTLHDIRGDVVDTIRQVVDVVSKYAGGALPEPARARVRAFILHLPRRWASAANVGTPHGIPDGTPGAGSIAGAAAGSTGNNRRCINLRHRKERTAGGPDRSLSATPVSSRASSPLPSTRSNMGRPTAGTATRAAQHILTLATESLDMMRGVTTVVKESLDRADAWVERLRIIGIQRLQTDELTTSPITSHPPPVPGLASTPSTPSLGDTPFLTPSTTPSAYSSPDEFLTGIRLSAEMSAQASESLSELRLDEDGQEGRDTNAGYERPKHGWRSLSEGGRTWEKRSGTPDMMVDG